ncbi:MAG: hypothetical protein GX241_00285 [Ruminococcaceae bacterium]|nr:hypothetical protein [Oscillospiraceae bacterium]
MVKVFYVVGEAGRPPIFTRDEYIELMKEFNDGDGQKEMDSHLKLILNTREVIILKSLINRGCSFNIKDNKKYQNE